MRPWSEVERLPRTADSGIGFVMTGGVQLGVGRLYALDLDACVCPATGNIEDWALRVLNTCKLSYTEITPSGTGLRVWIIAQRSPLHWGNKVFTPPGAAAPEGVAKKPELQVYGTGAANYVTVTGAQLIGTSNEILTIENMEWITDQFGGSILGRHDDTPAWLRKIEQEATDPLEHAHDLARARYVLQNVFPDPDALGYWPWFRLTAALASLGQAGRELAREWSAAGRKFNPLTDCTDERFDGLNGTIHIATLFAAADEVAPAWRSGFTEEAAAGESSEFSPVAAEPISSLFDLEDMAMVDTGWVGKWWTVKPLETVLSVPPDPWLIEGYIRKKQTGFLVAFSTVGKSTLAAAWISHVAYGAEWCGKQVLGGSVLALVGENLAGFARSIDAYRKHHQFGPLQADRHVDIVDFKLPISSAQGQNAIKALIEDWVKRRGAPPALIVMDTLSSHWAESEDASEFAAPAMRALGDLAARWGCAVLIVHHITKGPGAKALPELRDIRGSSAFFSNTDFTFAMAAPEKDAVLLAGLKLKIDRLPPTVRIARLAVACGEEQATAAVFENVAEIVTEAADEALKGPLGVAKDVEQEIWAIVAAVAKMGTAQKIDGVVAAVGLKQQRGRAAFSLALDFGLLEATGKGPATRYTVTPKGVAGCAFPPLDGEGG